MAISALLSSSLVAQRQIVTTGTGGITITSWSTRGDLPANLPCRIQPAGWAVQRQFNADNSLDLFEVFTQIDLGVAPQDRLIVDGVTYTVLAYRPQTPLPGLLAVYQTVVGKLNS